jgi:hypothetical protein
VTTSATRRSGPVLATLATLLALWLGLTAPATSPVPAAPVVRTAVDIPPPVPADRGRDGGRR